MKFAETKIPGAFRILPEMIEDERGGFGRLFCQSVFRERKLPGEIRQTSLSRNSKAGTLRGMHYQRAPAQEAKIVSCLRGRLYDVILDLRPASPAFGKWESHQLDASEGVMLYIPEGCAHGFQTLTDHTEVYYQMFEFFRPELAAGVRYNDARFAIHWPLPVSVISEKDLSYDDFEQVKARGS